MDKARLGDSFENNTAVEVKMGCHDSAPWSQEEAVEVSRTGPRMEGKLERTGDTSW